MRAALRGLTTRGRCLLAAGLAAALCAFLLGEKDLLRVAIFLLALPLLSVALLARTRFKLACYRHTVPDRVAVGHAAEVQLRLHNVALLPTSVLLLEDELPYTLGGRPRFTVARIGAGQQRLVCYPVRSDLRGRYRLGPLRLRLTDAFGLVELTRSFSAVDRLTVVPAVTMLPPTQLSGAHATGTGATVRAIASRGEDDAATREYRHGDDLRKVHWRSTARVGKLMVRREERSWQQRATLLLDTRNAGHHGQPPASSFEWAVSAVASIGVHLIRHGFVVALMTHARMLDDGISTEEALLDHLADAALARGRTFTAVTAAARAAAREGTFIAVLGSMRPDEAHGLATVRAGKGSSVAILLDTPSWVSARGGAHEAGLAASARVFGSNGWRVVTADRRGSLPHLWSRVGRDQHAVLPPIVAGVR